MSAPTPYPDEETKEKIEKLVPYSEAKVFRTDTGFVVRDNQDEDWCKFIPFDDLDRVQTRAACKTLEPARINAMRTMPLPSFTAVPKEFLDEYEKDFEKICLEDREKAKEETEMISTVQICTLTLENDEPLRSSTRLTREDLMKHQFGTLAPYVEDYTNDVYEVEENFTTHMPSLTQAESHKSSMRSPLSYQKTVLRNDPLISESFEKKRPGKTESLYNSATSEQGSDMDDNEDNNDNDDALSSLIPSSLERKLYLIEQEERRKKQPRLTEEDEFDLPPLEEDIDDWTLLKRSMPKNLILNGFITTIMFIFMMVGVFVQANLAFIFGIFFVINIFGQKTFQGLCTFFPTFIDKFLEKRTRKRFTNQAGRTPRMVKNPLKPPIKPKKNNPGLDFSPFDGIMLTKPEGAAGFHKKVKRTYHIEPARISEARVVKLNDNRPYFIAKFGINHSKYVLLDSGASCCTIHPKYLEELQQHTYIPTEEVKIGIQGFVPSEKQNAKRIAYLDFQLETGHTLRHIPFLVYSGNCDILVGSNLIRGQRWANCWKNADYYIDLGTNKPLVPLYFEQHVTATTNAVSVDEITIYPSQITTIGLKIPQLSHKMDSPFKHQDLLVEPLFEPEEGDDIEIIPSLSKLSKNQVSMVIRNNGELPFTITEGQELAKVTTVTKETVTHTFEEITQARRIYNSIPRIYTSTCHCQQKNHAKDNETVIQILISDPMGNTSIGNFQDPLKPQPFKPGIKIIKHDLPNRETPNKKRATILLVTDEDGGLGGIDKSDMKRARASIRDLAEKQGFQPLFFFINPLSAISFTSRFIITELWEHFQFSFFPVYPLPGHEHCVRPALRMNVPELLAATNKTKIHLQNGPAPPTDELLVKEKGSPVIKIPFKEATLLMFRNQTTLQCHFHLPAYDSKHQLLSEASRSYYISWLFSELRQLRIPTNVEITADGLNSVTGSKVSLEYYNTQLKDIARTLLFFPTPSARTLWPFKISEELPEMADTVMQGCKCTLCTGSLKTFPQQALSLFNGNINDLISRSKEHSHSGSLSNISQSSRITTSMKAKIASICEMTDDFDNDQPLDPMELCPEEEMQIYLKSHPGREYEIEAEDLDESKLPPPIKSDPTLFEGYDMEGIPDQHRPGDWRDTDMMERVHPSVPQHIKEALGRLLDKHRNVLSYFPTDCRPVLLHGKPAVLDVKLKTDQPIFMKPYMQNGIQVDMLDNKLHDLYTKNEIHPIESKYNMAVILTHHNSSQKFVSGIDKLVRMVLDLRIFNGLMLDKNINSYLVKAIEPMYMILQGSEWFCPMDITKAFRSIVASQKLQEMTAFRCPSSRKYPHVTWAFRSACDGLANMPGYYSYVMQEALSVKSKQITITHIDDVLVFSKTMEDHLEHIDTVLTDLGKSNFLVSAKKLKPFQKEVHFLGHMLNGQEKWIPDDRKSYFEQLEPPRTKKQLQSFCGLMNYMANHLDSISITASILYDAMKGVKDKVTFQLNDIQMKAFKEIKRQIIEAPSLALLDTSKPIIMETDASLIGCGSIAYQLSEKDGKEIYNVIRYGSRRFSITESLNHTSLEREAMAIIISAKQHMMFLQACPEAIIKTDLKSLISILSCYRNPDSKTMASASHKIYNFPFKWKLIHIPGTELPFADSLSRIYPYYTSLYHDRHLRYPDLKRDNIIMPAEWRKDPNMVLTTADLLQAMRRQIMFIEKSSNNIKEKRLKALINEVSLLYAGLGEAREQLATDLENDLLGVQDSIKNNAAKRQIKVNINALTAVSPRALISPEFIIKHQNSNPKLHNIITMLRTVPRDKIPSATLKRYRLLNDSILITKKNKTKPFDHPGNLRIVCDSKMTIHILALIHVMSCHYGMNILNHTFNATYKCIEGSAQGFVKLVCTGCRSCQFHRNTNKKVVPELRIPLPNQPNDVWMIDFMVFKQEQTFKGRKVVASFNVMDLFSNIFISIPVKDQKAATVIECLKMIFAQYNVPRKIVSDNAQALCRSPEVLHFLKSNNVKVVATVCAHRSSANKVERLHKIFRETLQLIQETFRRETQFDMYYTVVHMINSRPLTLSLHPNVKNICKEMGEEPGIVTPFSLHFGLPPEKHLTVPLENTLEPEDRGAFRAKWKHIITEHDKMLQKELDERLEQFKGRVIEIGDLVLIRNKVAHKEQLKYYKEVYEVIKINKAKYFCAPLFSKGNIMEVHGNNLKPYTYSELFDILPSSIRNLMGENLSPEQLKELAEKEPHKLPADLENWQQWRPPTMMNLRNRITPPDRASEPALSIVETDILSETTDTSSGLSIPDSIPDHASELSSLFNHSGVSQLRTSKTGIVTEPYKVRILLKQRTPITQRHAERKDISKQAVTIDDVEKSWEKKIRRQKILDYLRHRSKETMNDIMNATPIEAPKLVPLPVDETPLKHDISDNIAKVTDDVPFTNQIEDDSHKPIDDSKSTLFPDVGDLGDTTIVTDIEPITRELQKQPIAETSTISKLIDSTKKLLKSPKKIQDTPQITPTMETKSPKKTLSNIVHRLRSRSKIRKPLRFQDPNYTK